MGISYFIQNSIIGITFRFSTIRIEPRWVRSKLVRELGWIPNDRVRGRDFPGKVIEEGFPVGESDGGDTEGEGVVHVIGVLELVILDVENQSFKVVEVALLGTVGGFGGTWKGILRAESELVVDSDDIVELTPDCEVAEGGKWVHRDGIEQEKEGKFLTGSMILAGKHLCCLIGFGGDEL